MFCNTRAMVNRLTTRLSNRGFPVVALSGELSQSERTHALQAMRDGRARVCVATDVAARGIDLPNLDLVIHAELPTNQETLLHRSGRTGRAGRKGVSVMIVPPVARKKAERLLGWAKVSATWTEAPGADAVRDRDEARMLANPAWADPIDDSDRPTIDKLTQQFSAEQIAAMFLRQHRERHSAPEELSDADSPAKPRAPFGPSVWFSLAGGRATGAEPRRLLPMLCNLGDVTRDDIGAIRIQDDAALIELRASALDGFLKAVGPAMALEGASLRQLAVPPVIDRAPRRTSERDKPSERPARLREVTQPSAPAPAPKPGTTAPVDWNDAPKPRVKKPKPGFKAQGRPKDRPAADVTPDAAVKPRKARHSGATAKAADDAQGRPRGPKPPPGKPNSKKNRARSLAAKNAPPSDGARKPGKPKKPKGAGPRGRG